MISKNPHNEARLEDQLKELELELYPDREQREWIPCEPIDRPYPTDAEATWDRHR